MLPALGHIIPPPLRWRSEIAESRIPRRTFWGAFGKMFLSIVAFQITCTVLIKWAFGKPAIQDGPVTDSNLPLVYLLIFSMILASAHFHPFIAGRLADMGMRSKWPRRAYVSLIAPLLLAVASITLWLFGTSLAMTLAMFAILSTFPAHMLLTLGIFCGLLPSQTISSHMVPPETEVQQ